MTLLDRAARALAASQMGRDDWDTLNSDQKVLFQQGTRAVLKCLRDPDIRMAQAGAEIIRNVGQAESEFALLSDAENTWRFMIDALLEER
jgi:hypothetical protein